MQHPHGFGGGDGTGLPFGCDLLKRRRLDWLSSPVLPLFFGNGDALPLTLDRSKLQQEKNGAKRLRQLHELNINPVTIESRAGIDMLPSLQNLLKMTCV